MRQQYWYGCGFSVAMLASMPLWGSGAATAVSIELNDVAADRVERQRAFVAGRLPLPGTPDVTKLESRLEHKGVRLGAPVFIRIFKAESELELWMRQGDRFILLDTYPICHWSGTLGPKLSEGDKQNPEGFYTIGSRQLHRSGRWPRSLNLGYPNRFDRSLSRTGSYILVHGGCSSTGCFAMTDAVIDEIYKLARAALRAGQRRIHVHVFPFRMTEANLAAHADSPWLEFWRDLKAGHDAFAATNLPPRIGVCEKHYVAEYSGPKDATDEGVAVNCRALHAAAQSGSTLHAAADATPGPVAHSGSGADTPSISVLEPPQSERRTGQATAHRTAAKGRHASPPLVGEPLESGGRVISPR